MASTQLARPNVNYSRTYHFCPTLSSKKVQEVVRAASDRPSGDPQRVLTPSCVERPSESRSGFCGSPKGPQDIESWDYQPRRVRVELGPFARSEMVTPNTCHIYDALVPARVHLRIREDLRIRLRTVHIYTQQRLAGPPVAGEGLVLTWER